MTPELTLVTGTRNREWGLRTLMNSIVKHTVVPWELIITDASDFPIDETGFPENVLVIPERPRLGFSKGYNAAFRRASGKYAIWLNDDAEVTPGYDTASIAFMDKYPFIGIGCISYSNKGNTSQVNYHEGMVYPNFGIIPVALGNAIGWLDDDFPMYGADNAVAFKMLLNGYGVTPVPDAHLIHHEAADANRKENDVYEKRLKDYHLLIAKYYPRLTEIKKMYEACLSRL